MADADDVFCLALLGFLRLSGITTDEALVDPGLGLVSKVVVNTRNDDDQPVPRICRLADQARIVGRLSALDVTDHHATPIPRNMLLGVAQPTEDLVRHRVR